MKIRTNIFNNFCFTAILALLLVQSPFNTAIAATNGCEDEKNDFINQRLALCSTHAYNIGLTQNPSDNSLKQTMNEVVALKTTIMTQQMKKQYDYLEVTIKRFKTQLEKAILVSKLEASGAASSSSSNSSSVSTDRNVILAGTENCNNKSTRSEVYTCLRNNYNVIYNMSNNGQNVSADVRKQLASDFVIAVGNLPSDSKGNKIAEFDTKSIKCDNFQSISSRDALQTCLNALNANIRNAQDTINDSNRSTQRQP